MGVSRTPTNTNLVESDKDSAERLAQAETARVPLSEHTGSPGVFSRTKFHKQRGNEFPRGQKTDAKETRD